MAEEFKLNFLIERLRLVYFNFSSAVTEPSKTYCYNLEEIIDILSFIISVAITPQVGRCAVPVKVPSSAQASKSYFLR